RYGVPIPRPSWAVGRRARQLLCLRGMNIVARSLAPIAAVPLFLAAAAPAPASAGSPTDQLRSRIDRVASALEDPGLRGASNAARRRAEIRKIADDIFDFEAMAKRALDRHRE